MKRNTIQIDEELEAELVDEFNDVLGDFSPEEKASMEEDPAMIRQAYRTFLKDSEEKNPEEEPEE